MKHSSLIYITSNGNVSEINNINISIYKLVDLISLIDISKGLFVLGKNKIYYFIFDDYYIKYFQCCKFYSNK